MSSEIERSEGGERELSPPKEEKIVQTVREAAQRSKRFVAEQEHIEGGRIGGWVGTKHQLSNILALVTASLVVMLLLSIAGSIIRGDIEYFKVIGVPILGTLTTIIGYLAGQHSKQPQPG